MRLLPLVIAICVVLPLGAVSASEAQPKEHLAVKKARESYEAQVRSALAPINRRYITQLEKLQKDLTRKGDLEGAMSAKAELRLVNSQSQLSQKASFTGTWLTRHSHGLVRTYNIHENGTVDFRDKSRSVTACPMRHVGNEVLIDLGTGTLVKAALRPILVLEYFKSLDYPNGEPFAYGYGERTSE